MSVFLGDSVDEKTKTLLRYRFQDTKDSLSWIGIQENHLKEWATLQEFCWSLREEVKFVDVYQTWLVFYWKRQKFLVMMKKKVVSFCNESKESRGTKLLSPWWCSHGNEGDIYWCLEMRRENDVLGCVVLNVYLDVNRWLWLLHPNQGRHTKRSSKHDVDICGTMRD
jgi:hypothetical protein